MKHYPLKSFLLLYTLFSIIPCLLFAQQRSKSPIESLFYLSPAAQWEETLPLGNGRLGMMPDGGIYQERIVLNEISMWSGSIADYRNPEASKSLPHIRQLLFKGKNKEAQEIGRAHV